MVGFAIPFGVLQIQNIRGAPHKNPSLITKHRRRPGQIVRVNSALVENSIAIRVLQQPNPPEMRFLVPSLRIIDHLRDEEPPSLIERHRHRAGDRGFRRHQLHVKPLPHPDAPHRLGGSHEWSPRQVLRRHLGLRPAHNSRRAQAQAHCHQKMSGSHGIIWSVFRRTV